MVIPNRKIIEEFYEKEWREVISNKACNLLIELTCQAYQLNRPPIPQFVKEDKLSKPQDLGQI